MTATHRRCWWLALLLLGLCGCYQTPQQRLHGRWYNHEMSLRFRPDGSVLFNSESGVARGRYFFAVEPQALAGPTATRNLLLDVVRNGRREQLSFDATFLADDRLRLHDTTPRPIRSQPTESIQQFALLRKATDSTAPRGLTSETTGKNRRSS